jgi:peroxiredoxin Q/BCP
MQNENSVTEFPISEPFSMVNQPVPDFELPSTAKKNFQLSAAKGRTLVIYFYPKDDTPGCTTEGGDFRDWYKEFNQFGCDVVGISRDSVKSHQNFKAKMDFPFELLSDSDETVCELFGVMKMKNMYGKQVRGIERSTFVIDSNGILRREWRGVKIPGHVEEVLEFVKTLPSERHEP